MQLSRLFFTKPKMRASRHHARISFLFYELCHLHVAFSAWGFFAHATAATAVESEAYCGGDYNGEMITEKLSL